ncbi:alpha-N-acetylglucosaminidase [Polaribacter batillariae]|uniref:Alpha-N-acetylglucosaminidase n=1 Tax=Polaribacter batillariae TaxID=2808900 RepID=A0ABX7SQ89_9FLAO|nr:alpha-N-acetylglucosaminidase [Polaribacter batillariae]QTD36380.1 alpha-N-acetylglucosaminidase [Polaribacter batillariae]
MKNTILLLTALLIFNCTTKNEGVNALDQLTVRILGKEKAKNFIFEKTVSITDKDKFTIDFKDGKVLIKGNSNIALASGFNWYLRYFTNSHISWETQRINLPEKLPIVANPVTKKSPFTYSYYLNYCTFNYSMAFWDWERWEKEIDWMAMNGVNLPLAIVGVESVWKKTLERLDFTEQEINEFIPGPAFNAWWLMGNLEGWGGPISDEYIEQQATLQKKILSRMKELEMSPILPGFYGMVPNTLKNKYPEADVRDQGHWAGGFKRPAFLSPTDPLFNTIAKIYYEELKKEFGDAKYFSGDPFHEGGSKEGINLTEAGKNIVHGMRQSFPESTWVFQGWQGSPVEKLIKDIKETDLLILDLDCDNRPQWEDREGWKQKPWIWNAIINFGGNTGLFGRMEVLAEEPFRALNHKEYSKGLKGIGAMMEGIENNYVMYELLFELKWHDQKINLNNWLSAYIERRYGKENKNLYKAWQILRKTVYGKKLNKTKSQQGTSESILCARPALEIEKVSSWGTSELYYNPLELLQAWTIFVNQAQHFKNNEGFEYDLLDITRQVLANHSQTLHKNMVSAFYKKDKKNFEKIAEEFLQLLDDQNTLLNSNEHFMLGKWIKDARERGTNPLEKDLFEYNARTQITTWSFQDSNLHEYSHREWAGLLSDFYKPRWEMFINFLKEKLDNKNAKAPNYYTFEEAWTKQKNTFPSKPINKTLKQVQRIYNKYHNKIKSNF